MRILNKTMCPPCFMHAEKRLDLWFRRLMAAGNLLYLCQVPVQIFWVSAVLYCLVSVPPACAGNVRNYPFLQHITRARYPHAHAVLARETETIKFGDNGTSVDTDEVFLTILDQDGIRQNGVQTFYINKHYTELTFELFEVIESSGKVRAVDLSKYSKEDSSASSSSMNIYDPAQRELKVFIPELGPGDTIHYRVVKHEFKAMIPGEFFGRIMVEYSFPVREYHIEITGPESRRLHTFIKDSQSEKISSSCLVAHGRTTRIFEFRDVPAMVPEPYMPPLSRVVMRLLFSTLDSWGEVSRWYSALVEPHLAPTAAIKERVRELTAGCRTREEKLAAIFYFVAQKIRYMGITAEHDRPGYEPHDVSLTFSRRYGVCRDKAALLVTMLREADFHAVPVMINAGNKLDMEVVVPWFNHAIVAVLDENGLPSIYLDPTSETSLQFLPDYERDSSCLAASDHGAELLLTPEPEAANNCSILLLEDRLDSGGMLAGTLHASFSGFCDTAMRAAMMHSSHERRRQMLEEFLGRRVPGVVISDLEWSDPENRGEELSFSCSFRAVNRVRETAGGCLLFFPASSMKYIGVLDKFLLEKASLVHRKYPLRMDYVVKSSLVEHTDLGAWCSRFSVTLPVLHYTGKHKCAGAGYGIKIAGNVLVIQRNFQVAALEVPPEDYDTILSVQRYLARIETTPVMFLPAEQSSFDN